MADTWGDLVWGALNNLGARLTLVLPGILTSLWTAQGGRVATAVVHDVNAGRYEAFHLTLSCAR